MTAPFYVSPEQWYQDKAEYARKGIARCKPIVALDFEHGIGLMAENRSAGLRKLAEIYDLIGFAAVGQVDEYENLRKGGVRYADMRGFSFSREDVAAAGLANEYSTALGTIFTREMKPFEVELLVCEVGEDKNTYYRILFDGSIFDQANYVSIGGDREKIEKVLKEDWKANMPLGDAVHLGNRALQRGNEGSGKLGYDSLEIALLDRRRQGRRFKRLRGDEIDKLLG